MTLKTLRGTGADCSAVGFRYLEEMQTSCLLLRLHNPSLIVSLMFIFLKSLLSALIFRDKKGNFAAQ